MGYNPSYGTERYVESGCNALFQGGTAMVKGRR